MTGWQPRPNEERRRDFTRAHDRARRLRSALTPSETRLWKFLRVLNREGANFRKQAHVAGYVFDFAALSAKLLIEVDGGVHALPDVAVHDEKKAEAVLARGYYVLRITNKQVWSNPEATFEDIRKAWEARRPSPQRGEGREGRRSIGRTARKVARFQANVEAAARPLPLPPPPGAGNASPETAAQSPHDQNREGEER